MYFKSAKNYLIIIRLYSYVIHLCKRLVRMVHLASHRYIVLGTLKRVWRELSLNASLEYFLWRSMAKENIQFWDLAPEVFLAFWCNSCLCFVLDLANFGKNSCAFSQFFCIGPILWNEIGTYIFEDKISERKSFCFGTDCILQIQYEIIMISYLLYIPVDIYARGLPIFHLLLWSLETYHLGLLGLLYKIYCNEDLL